MCAFIKTIIVQRNSSQLKLVYVAIAVLILAIPLITFLIVLGTNENISSRINSSSTVYSNTYQSTLEGVKSLSTNISTSQIVVNTQFPSDTQITPTVELSSNFYIYIPVIDKGVKGYFVSPNGNDSNPGTNSLPWRTINHAVGKLRAGDVLYVRGGTYREIIIIHNSGTQSNPIVISNYANEVVIIDGNNMTSPSHESGTPLISLEGDWIIVKNLTVSNSGEYGVSVEGDYDVVDNLYVHHNWGNGVTLQGNYDLAQNLRLWSNSMKNEGGILRVSWGAGITCARYPTYCTIRKSMSWENWGEGISTFESLHSTIEDNISYDNMANIYVSDTRYTLVQRNFSYYTAGTKMDFTTTNGILVGDELGVPNPLSSNGVRSPSSDNIFINNIIYGGNHGLNTNTSVNNNNLYAFNTFGNSGGNTQEPVNVLLNPGTCTNCRFIDNIVVQDDQRKIISVEGSGWTINTNLWSKHPEASASSPSDIVSDPLFAKTNDPYHADWYMLTGLSPTIDKAVPLPEVIVDYFGNPRTSKPDIGADEY